MQTENSPKTEKEKSQSFNVLILPSAEVAKEAIDLSKQISEKFQTKFSLDGVDLLPHITMYLAEYPSKNFTNIKTFVQQIAQETKPFSIRLEDFSAVSGFIFWDVVKNRLLQSLHEKVLKTLNPLREGLLFDVDLPGLTEGQRKGMSEYGYALALEEYLPHITLTRLIEHDQTGQVIANLPPVTAKFKVESIYLALVGEEGTCPGVIEKFSLKT